MEIGLEIRRHRRKCF